MKLQTFHSSAMSWTATLVDAVPPHALSAPTPIGWTVGQLLGHLVAVNTQCRNSAAGIGPEHLPDQADLIGDDVLAAYRRSAVAFSQAFERSPDLLGRDLPTPMGPYPGEVVLFIGSLENLVHAWDLGRGLGLSAALPQDLAGDAAARVLGLGDLFDRFREYQMYGAPQPVGPDGTTADRLLAHLGRAPGAVLV